MMHQFMNQNLSRMQPSGIRRFTALARSTPGCSMLTIGEPDFDTPAPIRESAIHALTEGVTHYPPNNGDAALREAISAFEREQNDLSYTPDEIIVTNGANEALYLALGGILNPGDEVIIPTPAFSLYESITLMFGAVPVFLDTTATDFQIDPERLRACITPRTKALVLNSPNNPSGVVLTDECLQAVHDVVAAHKLFIVCDEVYNRLIYTKARSFAQFADLRGRILAAQSFSKPYAMTGWRVGYLMADAPLIPAFSLMHAATVSCISAFSQKACIDALNVDVSGMLHTYRERRDYICARLSAMDLSFPQPQGAFYVFPSIEKYGMDAEDFCIRMIREGGVAGVPGTCFCAPGYLRFSYCYSLSEIEKAMDKLEIFLKAL